MNLSNRIYDILKYFCTIFSPAMCTLLVTLASLWHLNIPFEAIVGTITAITTFVGVLIGLSSAAYNRKDDSNDT